MGAEPAQGPGDSRAVSHKMKPFSQNCAVAPRVPQLMTTCVRNRLMNVLSSCIPSHQPVEAASTPWRVGAHAPQCVGPGGAPGGHTGCGRGTRARGVQVQGPVSKAARVGMGASPLGNHLCSPRAAVPRACSVLACPHRRPCGAGRGLAFSLSFIHRSPWRWWRGSGWAHSVFLRVSVFSGLVIPGCDCTRAQPPPLRGDRLGRGRARVSEAP